MSKKYWESYFDAIRSQNWEKALVSLNTILEKEPKNAQVHLKVGDVFQKTGDISNAVAAYHQSAWLLMKEGFHQKTLAIFKIILRLDPDNAEAINKSKELMMEIESSKVKAPPIPAIEPGFEPEIRQEVVGDFNMPAERGLEEKVGHETFAGFDLPSETKSESETEQKGAEVFEPETVKDVEGEASEKIDDLFKKTTFDSGIEQVAGEEPGFSPETDFDSREEEKSGIEPPGIKTDDFFAGTSIEEDFLETTPPAELPVPEGDEILTKTEDEISAVVIPPFLRALPEDEAAKIISRIEPQSFTPGENIIEEGDSGDSIFVIKSGHAKVVAHILGKEMELATLSDNDVFGEVAFLTGRPRTASVTAIDKIEVMEFNRLILEDIFEKYPETLKKVQDFYQSHVQDTLQMVRKKIKK